MAPNLQWEDVMALSLDELEGEQGDEAYEQLAEFDPGEEEDSARLKKLFLVTQKLMLIKGSLAEECEAEMERMAREESKAQGKKDKEFNELRREVEELRRENKNLKRFGPDAQKGGGTRDVRHVREEINDLEHQVEQLLRDLREKERQLQDEQAAVEREAARANQADREARDMKHEIDQLKDDLRDYQRQVDAQRESMAARQDVDSEYQNKLTSKTKLLSAALEENAMLAESNFNLEKKMEDMKEKLQEARVEMDRTTDDYMKLKLVVQSSDKLMEDIRRENDMLRDQINDLQEQVKSNADADDEIMAQVNKKVDEWKMILSQKDEENIDLQNEMTRLKEQLIAANMDSEKTSVAALTKAVEQRDKKIEELKAKLEDAATNFEINESIIADVRNELSKGTKGTMGERQMKRLLQLQATMQEKDEHLQEAERKAQQAEKDASEKEKQLTEAMERMRQYESGEYGLAEAVAEIKECKQKITHRDKQLEEYIQMINQLELKVNELYDESEDLRERLGLDPQAPLDTSKFINKKAKRMQEDRALNKLLQNEVERLEEERLNLRQQNRKLAIAAGQRAAAMGLDADHILNQDVFATQTKSSRPQDLIAPPLIGTDRRREAERDDTYVRNIQLDGDIELLNKKMESLREMNSQLKMKNKDLEEENKQMETGLKEIHAALKEQGQDESHVIQCPTLERMLSAIEAKNLVGRYDTSLYLKAQVDNLTGHNEELRQELKQARFEATKTQVHLDRAQSKLENLEGELKTLREVDAGGHFQAMPLPQGMAVTSSDVIASLNEHLVQVLQEVSLKEDMLQKVEGALETYKQKYAVMRHQQSLLYQEYMKDKKEWENSKDKFDKEIKDLQGAQAEEKVKTELFDRLLDILSQDEVEIRRELGENVRKMTVLRVNEKALTRRYTAMEEIETTLRKENNKLSNEMIQMEKAITERLGYLQRYKDMASFKIAALQKALDDCVPAADLENANRQYTELTEKYRDLLERSNTLVVSNEASRGFEAEIERFKSENEELKQTMEVDKEKLHTLEAAFEKMRSQGMASSGMLSDSDAMSLSNRLTVLEMKELNERQRADHAHRMMEQHKTQLRQVEERNYELEQNFKKLTKMNLEAQKTERELRDELTNSVPKSVSDADRKRISDMERSEMEMKTEVAKLKEISEIATVQCRLLDARQVSRDKEVTSLRQQLLDFQSQSDEKTVIGKLHRHIIQLQISEGTAVRKLEDALKKISKMESQLLRTEQKLDDKDQTIFHNRQESRSKVKHLKSTVQDLRRRYAGSVPLQQQEKFADAMIRIQEDKAKMEEKLRLTNEEREKVHAQLEEVELQMRGLHDLIATLKDGKGAQKVVEWHGKMETIRLESVRLRRQTDKLKHQMHFHETMSKKHEAELMLLEEEKVRLAKEFELREMEWEQRELELERMLERMERTQADLAGAATQFESAVGSLPDPNWPVSKQLEHAVTTIKANIKIILDSKAEAEVLKKQQEDLRKAVKEKEKEVIVRDKIITELRLRLPASKERDDAIVKATAAATASSSQLGEENPEERQALRVAQSTMASLQARISQKEQTLQKYQELLRQARDDMSAMNLRHEEELKNLHQKLQQTHDAAFSSFKQAALHNEDKPQSKGPTHQQLKRLNELEDMVAEQDNSLAAMRDKLSKARNEIQDWKFKFDELVRTSAVEKEKMLGEHASAEEEMQQHIKDLDAEILQRDQNIETLRRELESEKENNSRAPTTTMKNMVERLKNQLSLKEKQHQALSKALMELRADMVTQAEDDLKAASQHASVEQNVQRVVDKQTKHLQEQIDELTSKNDKLRSQLKKNKDKSESVNLEVEELRAENGKREKQVLKLKEDKTRLENEVEELEKKIERMSTMSRQKGVAEGIYQELDELRRKNRLLMEELKRKQHQPEKPYEQMQAKDEHKEEAVAKWEESKKWQKMVERLKSRLKDKEQDIEKLTKSNEMLKNGLERANKDKDNLEQKLKIASRPVAPSVDETKKWATRVAPPDLVEPLKRKNYELEEEVTRLRKELTMGRDAAFEEVMLRNKFLQEKLDSLEVMMSRRAASSQQDGGVNPEAYWDSTQKEQRLQKDVIKLNEENIELKFEVEQSRRDIPRLKERIEDLQKYLDVLKAEKDQLLGTSKSFSSSLGSPGGNVRRIGESGKSQKELEKTVSLLKKVVERTQAENEQLKKSPLSSEHFQALKRENESLKNQMEELRQNIGATLNDKLGSQQKGTAKVLGEHDKLRKDLIKEKEAGEKMKIQIRQQELKVEQLEKDLQDKTTKLQIEEAKRPSGSLDNRATVITRMYEGKVKALEEDLAKKNKTLDDVKVMLREAAEREQQLIYDNNQLSRKVEILERYPPGYQNADPDIMRDYQLQRLAVERLEGEKQELLNELKKLRQQVSPDSRGPSDMEDEAIVTKLRSYDQVMQENIDVKTQLKSVSQEKNKLQTELDKLKKELANFGPDFFEEIEDLKYNYREAVQRNVQYEEQLQQLSSRFGVDIQINGDL